MAEQDRLFLTFRQDRHLYALPAAEVAEVIRMPALARVPQAPRGLAGIANLRGTVLPVASLAGLLGRAAAGIDAGSRAIVLHGDAPVALAVDRVEALVSVPEAGLETRQAELAADAGERITAVFRGSGDEAAKVLDIRPLLAAAFAQPRRAARTHRVGAAPLFREGREVAALEKLVTFEVAGQVFALPLAEVREVVPAPAGLAAIPGSEATALGVAAWRDGLLALFSLRGLLGFPPASPHGRAKAIIAMVAGVPVGLVPDRMRDLLSVDPARIEPTPRLLAARAGGEARIASIYRGADGLVSLLSPDTLFQESAMRRLTQAANAAATPAAGGNAARAERRFLVFRLGEEEYALPIEAVDEVAPAPAQLTRVPKTPAFLEGVMNLRGQVLPVVDQRKRFGMPPPPRPEKCRLVVVRSLRHRAGLIVDSVTDVLARHEGEVEPAPLMAGDATPLVAGVINLEQSGRMILVLDPAELLSRTERGILDGFQEDGSQEAGTGT
jgi:purine-binding chemotaxis protein CheW